jgi:hypothetical protein
MNKIRTPLIILVMAALILVPVSGTDQNITNSTVPTTTVTGAESANTTQVTPNVTETNQANITKAIPQVVTTSLQVATTELLRVTTVTSTVPTTPPDTQAVAGNISVASSPLGASILIDGVYYGVSPGNITGISAGNHIMRLTLSGYYDYEGTFSVVPGQVTNVFGTLPPLGVAYAQPSTIPTALSPVTTAVPVATVQPIQTSSGDVLGALRLLRQFSALLLQ